METVLIGLLPFVGAVVGYVICLFQKGITINMTPKQHDPEKEGYLPDSSAQLPPEVRQYLETNQGYMNY